MCRKGHTHFCEKGESGMAEYRLEMRGVSKSFPGVKALDRVTLKVRPGTVHALMGENGAGKSTLMKCLFGIYHMDEGEVFVDGEKVNINNPDEALHKGLENNDAQIILPALKAISDTIAQNPLEQLAAYTKAIESDDEILKLDF